MICPTKYRFLWIIKPQSACFGSLMQTINDDLVSAVLFIREQKVVSEMLFTEFESVLDTFIPLHDYAGQDVSAVYLVINPQLLVTSAVFFRISFDQQGYADKRWNVPLHQLAESAAKGPNLGAGPINLACYTQCPAPWLQHSLWDPEMSPKVNHLSLLKKTISSNRLGLKFSPAVAEQNWEDNIPTLNVVEERRYEKALREELLREELEDELRAKYYRSFRNRLADTLKRQRLQLATARNRHRARLDELNRDHQRRADRLRSDNDELRTELRRKNTEIESLKDTIDSHYEKMTATRDYFEEKIKTLRHVGDEHMSVLNKQFEMEAEANVEAATRELKEQLQLRDIELTYISEHKRNLEAELETMRAEREQLRDGQSDKMMDLLAASGVSFVAYKSGLGHLNISRDELDDYLADPDAFAAKRCGVSLVTYRAWLEHFSNPICQAIKPGGEPCSEPVPRVTSPLDFHTGESDRCDHHRHNNVVKFSFGNNQA